MEAQSPYDESETLDLYVIPALLHLNSQGMICGEVSRWTGLDHPWLLEIQECLREGENFLAACDRSTDPLVEKLKTAITGLLDGGDRAFYCEYRHCTKQKLRWFQLTALRVEHLQGVVLILREITLKVVGEAMLRIQAAVGAKMTARLDLPRVCQALTRAICHELGWEYTAVWVIERTSWTLRCIDTWWVEGAISPDFAKANDGVHLAPGVGLPGRAWSQRSIQCVTDLDFDVQDQRKSGLRLTVLPPLALQSGLRSGLAFPVKWDDDVLLVAEIFSVSQQIPDARLLGFIETVCAQMALSELRERAELRAEAVYTELAAARDQLESILDCAPVAITVVDGAGLINFVSAGANITASQRESLIGTHWHARFPEPCHAPLQAALDRVLETTQVQVCETFYNDANGRPKWFSNHLGPIRNEGTINGAVIVSQPITEAKLAAIELANAQRLASVGTLAAGVAHEINTPIQFVGDSIFFLRESTTSLFEVLNSCIALQDLLGNTAADPTALRRATQAAKRAIEDADLEFLQENLPQALDRCEGGLERVATIVRSMKEFTHTPQQQMSPADINRAIQSTLVVATSEYKYVADVVVDLAPLPPVTCHINEINQAVLNLIVNASHAIGDVVRGTERRGTLKVTTVRDGDDVVITVQDSGSGIPESIRERIFEPFFTTKEVGRGTGQGLSQVWAVIKEKHGGSVTVESTVGQGSAFSLRLPIHGKALARAA